MTLTYEENYFQKLYKVDVRDKTKEKNGLNYLSWATAWAVTKKAHPDAIYRIYETETGRPWFDDGKTGWVKTGVTINNIEHIEYLPVMDFKNKSMSAETITSADANKSIQRSLTKACARHGVGLYIYEGEDLPEESKLVDTLQADCMALITKKCAISDKAKKEVGDICKAIDESANGNPKLITDVAKLETLKKQLLAVRK